MAVQTRAASFVVLLIAAIMAGCATSGLPAAVQPAPATGRPVPVILIPGVLGSRLGNPATGIEAWPGTTTKLMTSDYLELSLRIDPVTLEPLDDGLVATGLFESAAGQDFYGRLAAALQRIGGYRRAAPGEQAAPGEERLYVLAYDWRQDNIQAVRALDALIDQIRRDYGDPQLRVDVIGHSMGGLIVRYYERYGTDDVMDGNAFPVTGAGVSKLRRIVLLSVPNQGAVAALHSFLTGYRVWLSRLPTEGIATMPAMYQLLPHLHVPWITDIRGVPLPLDPFNIEVWRNFGWSVFDRRVQRRMAAQAGRWPEQAVFERYFEKRLARGRRFAWSLMVPTGDIRMIQPLAFGGDCLPTLARVVVEEQNGEAVARLLPEQILHPLPDVDYDELMFEPGDNSITTESVAGRYGSHAALQPDETAAGELGQPSFVCEVHEGVTSNDRVLDGVLRHLMSPD